MQHIADEPLYIGIYIYVCVYTREKHTVRVCEYMYEFVCVGMCQLHVYVGGGVGIYMLMNVCRYVRV